MYNYDSKSRSSFYKIYFVTIIKTGYVLRELLRDLLSYLDSTF